MKGRLIIFDLDGVLVDACEWHRAALNEALKEVCDYEISLQDHHNTFNGIPTRVKLRKLTDMGLVEEKDHDHIYKLKQSKTVEIIRREGKIRPEKQAMINALKTSGATVACYTNSIRMTAELMLEKTGILDLFDHVLTNQDVQKSKPDPEGYLFLMDYFGISAENTYIIEDSPKGLKAAYSSGANVIEVENPEGVDTNLFTE
jgi:HAD superfamily hydrolase (TIGR01509 family)